MITRTHRFHGYNALKHAYARGQTVRGPLLSIKYVVNTRRSSYRAAIVVSRKVHKSAVVRGRIRRRLYEIIRQHEAVIDRPYDMIFTVFSDQLATMPAPEVRRAIETLLKRSHISNPTTGSPLVESARHAIVDAKEFS